jgi:outer membrane protein
MVRKVTPLILPICLLLSYSGIASAETKSLNLDQCLQTAYQNNQTLLQLEEKINSAQYKIEEARSGFYPQLSFNGSYTRLGSLPEIEIPAIPLTIDSTTLTFGPMSMSEGAKDNYILTLGLQQPLYTWGKIRNGYNISQHGFTLAKENYRLNKQEVKFNVVSIFYNIILARELIKVREESIKSLQDHLKTVQDRYDKGYASEFDVLRAKVQLANAQPPLVQAKNLYKTALDNLKNLLGIALTDSINVEGELAYEPMEVNQSQAEEYALKNRAELNQLREQKRISQLSLSIAQAGNKPTVVGAANFMYEKPYYFIDQWKTDWNVSLALNIPIFDGFLTRSKVRQAKSDLKQLDVSEAQVEDYVKLEITQAISDLNLAQENILSQQENVNQAKESLRIANVQYQNGVLTNLELLDTEFALTVAETNYLQALSDYIIAKAKFEKAIGKD